MTMYFSSKNTNSYGEISLKKMNLSKMIIVALIIVIAAGTAITISANNYQAHKNPSKMTQIINDGTGAVDKVIGAPIHYVQNKANDIGNLFDTYHQNASLKSQLAQNQTDENALKNAQAENKELKAALQLQETLSNYDKVAANVISRNPSSWDDTLTIDRGSKDGIKTDMVIMANNGVIGRVSQVSDDSAKVSLFSSKKGIENKLPVQLGSADSPTYGLLTSYDSKQGAYIVTSLTTNDNLTKGSQVFTSGLGGDAPRNLLVGTVITTKTDNQGLGREVFIKPSSSLYDVRFVYVVERMVGGN